MKKIKIIIKQIFVLCLIMSVTSELFAQVTLSSSENTRHANRTESHNRGELSLMYTTKTSRLIVGQGNLQPTAQALNAVDVACKTEINVYPNPIWNILYIDAYVEGGILFNYHLYDVNGKHLLSSNKTMAQDKEQYLLDMEIYKAGTYILNTEVIRDEKKIQHQFKIIKY